MAIEKTGKVRPFRDLGGEYRFRVKGNNNEIVATSQGYDSPSAARRGYADLLEVLKDPDVNWGVEDVETAPGQVHEPDVEAY